MPGGGYRSGLNIDPSEAQIIFTLMDTDGSGTLTPEECIAILTRKGGGAPLSLEAAQRFVAMFDANKDGVLDYEEFCTAMGQDAPAAPNTELIDRIMDGDTAAAVKAAKAKDGATLWEAYRRQFVLVYAGELESINSPG